jgi:hypothetical protein
MVRARIQVRTHCKHFAITLRYIETQQSILRDHDNRNFNVISTTEHCNGFRKFPTQYSIAMSDFEGWRTSTKVSDQLRKPPRVGHREPDFGCKWNGVRDCLFRTEQGQSGQRPTLVRTTKIQRPQLWTLTHLADWHKLL